MKLLAFLLYGSLQAVRYKDCGTTGMKINDIKGKSYTAPIILYFHVIKKLFDVFSSAIL